MTMNCPNCGIIMVWKDGSISHNTQIRHYECRNCGIELVTDLDGSYEITSKNQ